MPKGMHFRFCRIALSGGFVRQSNGAPGESLSMQQNSNLHSNFFSGEIQKFDSIFMPRITLQGELSCPYQRTDNAYPRYLDTVINDVKNEVDCEVKCTFYENFVCRSFAYYSSARQCFVSGDDTGKKRGLLD